jgi:hypothetical protein
VKKFHDEMKGMLEIMDRLSAHPCAAFFLKAIDPDAFPDYYTKIHNPIDLSLIKERLQKGRYASFAPWAKDMRLIQENTTRYFGKESPQNALANHLMYLFNKEIERYSATSVGRWTVLYSAQTNRLIRKLSMLPQSLEALSAVIAALSCAIPRAEVDDVEDEVTPPPKEQKEVKDSLNGISRQDQDRFLEAVGSLGVREARGFIEIVQRFHPHLALDGMDLEIEVEALNGECWKELIAFAQKRFKELGWHYPIFPGYIRRDCQQNRLERLPVKS